jgi:hypothetical protein
MKRDESLVKAIRRELYEETFTLTDGAVARHGRAARADRGRPRGTERLAEIPGRKRPIGGVDFQLSAFSHIGKKCPSLYGKSSVQGLCQ